MWAGRALTTLAVLPFIFSFIMKVSGSPQMLQGLAHLGWPEKMILTLAILEGASVLLYLAPRTAVLGGIVLTGYLGGAIATHLRVGEPVGIHIVIGILIWLGLFLREPRLGELLPIRGGDFRIEREIIIDRPSEDVLGYLRSLRNFLSWNPFLKPGCQAKVEFRGTDGQVGSILAWDGDRQVGAGEQEITRIVDGERIEFELRFKRPFASTNQAHFAADPDGGSRTRVRWMMSGKASFPMTVIGLFMNCDRIVGKEFDSGLSLLKTILEKGKNGG